MPTFALKPARSVFVFAVFSVLAPFLFFLYLLGLILGWTLVLLSVATASLLNQSRRTHTN